MAGDSKEIRQQLPAQRPVCRLGRSELIDMPGTAGDTMTPGGNNGRIDLRVELYPPGVADAKSLPGANQRSSQMQSPGRESKTVVVPLERPKTAGDPGKQRVGGPRRCQTDLDQPLFSPAVAADLPSGHLGQQLPAETDADQRRTGTEHIGHKLFERPQERMPLLVMHPHGTTENDDSARLKGKRFAKIDAQNAKRHLPLAQQFGEHAGRDFGVALENDNLLYHS